MQAQQVLADPFPWQQTNEDRNFAFSPTSWRTPHRPGVKCHSHGSITNSEHGEVESLQTSGIQVNRRNVSNLKTTVEWEVYCHTCSCRDVFKLFSLHSTDVSSDSTRLGFDSWLETPLSLKWTKLHKRCKIFLIQVIKRRFDWSFILSNPNQTSSWLSGRSLRSPPNIQHWQTETWDTSVKCGSIQSNDHIF